MRISKTTAPLLAMLLVTSAYAIENVKYKGEAKYWYQTTAKEDAVKNDLFQQETSVGVAAFEVGVEAELIKNLKGKASVMALHSLGLEQSFVKDISSGGAGWESDDNYYRTQIWATEANLEYTLSKTTVVLGRQVLNTPLMFTESWNAAYNTFDGALLMNKDIPNTTIAAGYIHQHNGGASASNATAETGFPSTTMHNGSYYGFGSSYAAGDMDDGDKRAYFLGAMIKPTKDLSVNLWGYNINSMYKAYWADAEYKISGLVFGVQNSSIDVKDSNIDNAMFSAAKIGYGVGKFTTDIAYSTTAEGEAGTAVVTNFATGDKSMAYTQAVFQDGATVGTRDSDAIRVSASYQFDLLKLTAFLQKTENDATAVALKEGKEFDLIATGKIGKYVNLTGMYIRQDVDNKTATDFKQDAVRLIASLKF